MSDKSASKYGGIAGLTVTEFVSISSIISAIPVIIIIGLGFLLIGWLLPESLSLLSFPLMLLVTALPLARFAIPATRGYFDQGIFNDHIERGETTAFAVRYLIANLIWMLPIGTFSWLTISTMSDTSSGYGFQLGAGGAMMLLLMIAAMIGSLLSIITTCLTEEIAELFDPSLWWGLVSEYLDHLMVFCASTIGAVFIFWLYFSIPMLLLVALAFSISDGFGSLLAGFFALLPVALAPVVLGRLAGALVYSLHFPEDQPASPTVTINPSAPITPTSSGKGAKPALAEEQVPPYTNYTSYTPGINKVAEATTTTPEPAPYNYTDNPHGSKLKLLITKMSKLQPIHANNAITFAQNASKARPDDIYPVAEECLILLTIERFQLALPLAEKVINLCIEKNEDELLIEVFQRLGNKRSTLKLANKTLRQMLLIFKSHQRFVAAVSVYSLLMVNEPDNQLIKQEIIELGDAAVSQNQTTQARKIYQFFIKKFPEDRLTEIANSALKDL